MRRTYHRHRNYTAVYLLPGCGSVGAPILLTLVVVGTLISLWFVTHIGVILSTILGLAILGNGTAFLLGMVYLGYVLLTDRPQQKIAPTHTVHIEEIRPVPAPAAVSPQVSAYEAPLTRPRIETPVPEVHLSGKRIPVYWDGRRIGWEDANGGLHFDHKTLV